MPPNSGVIMSATPSAPVDRHGRVGEHAEDHRARRALGRARAEHRDVERREHVGHLAPGGGDEVRPLAERRGQRAQLGFGLAVAAPGSGGRAGSSSSATARTTTSLRFLGWKREMQPTTNACSGMPSSPRTRARPSSVKRISSVRSTFGTTITFCAVHADVGDRAAACPRRPPSPAARARAAAQIGAARAGPCAAGTAPGPTPPTRPSCAAAREHAAPSAAPSCSGPAARRRAPRLRSAVRRRPSSTASAAPGSSQLPVESFGPIAIGRTVTSVSRPIPGMSVSITVSWPRWRSASSISTAANSAPPLESVVITLTIFIAQPLSRGPGTPGWVELVGRRGSP